MKVQNPKFKVQGSSPQDVIYPSTAEGSAWVLNEDSAASEPRQTIFDLEERTAPFGESIIRLCKKTPRGATTNRLIDQLIGCGASVGANYCEATEKVPKKDLKLAISRSSKEAKESKFFLRMLASAEPSLAEDARALYREAKELHLIFAAIYRK